MGLNTARRRERHLYNECREGRHMNRDSRFVRKILLTLAHAIIRFFSETLSGTATALECMDGRTHGALRKWGKKIFRVKYIDPITQKGMNKVLAENTNLPILENIKDHIWTSIKGHGSRVIIIAAHHDCAGNNVNKETQLEDLRKAAKTARKMIESLPLDKLGITSKDVIITLLWINETWMPEVVPFEETALKMSALMPKGDTNRKGNLRLFFLKFFSILNFLISGGFLKILSKPQVLCSIRPTTPTTHF